MTDMPVVVTRSRGQKAEAKLDLKVKPNIKETHKILSDYRESAWKTYQNLPLPTGKEEDWRRTSIKDLKLENLSLFSVDTHQNYQPPSVLTQPIADEEHGGQIIFTPANADVTLDEDLKEKGVIFDEIRTVGEKFPDILDKVFGKIIPSSTEKFAALAGALEPNGILLYVPKNVVIKNPLHSLYWAPGAGYVHSSHILVYLEEGASVTYVHESSSPSSLSEQSLHTGLMEIYVGPGASLRFVELQSWGENVWNFMHERINVDRDGHLDWIFGALGSRVTKNYSDLNLIGQGSTGKMSGFYFTDNQQHLDHDTQQNHLAPNTTSDLLFKGALQGASRSVWQGMIYVAPGASKTDGYQANRNLVLSDKARADSIPGLEILTDDVRCTHGATVGKIDEDQVFYLKSRGIPADTAERLIVEGFFDPIMQRIPFEGVRKRFQNSIIEKMESKLTLKLKSGQYDRII